MNNNLKFTDIETELFYEMIREVVSLNFYDNTTISFAHLYKLWDDFYRSPYKAACIYDPSIPKPILILYNHSNRE